MKKAVSSSDSLGPFKTVKEVQRYLLDSGWSIADTTIYDHCNISGQHYKGLRKKRGVYTKKDVDKYALANLVKHDSGLKDGEVDTLALTEIKLQKQIAKLDIEIREKEFKHEIESGKYILRSQVDLEIASRAGILDSGYNYYLNAKVLELIAIVGGDDKKAPAMVTALRSEWNNLLGEYSRLKNLDVIFKIGE